jgi:hypothetical protein
MSQNLEKLKRLLAEVFQLDQGSSPFFPVKGPGRRSLRPMIS